MAKIFKTSTKNLLVFFGVIFLILGISAALTEKVLAADAVPWNNGAFENPSTLNSVQAVTASITNWILGITAGITILFLIVGGLYYITAAGDDKKMEEGRKIINYAVIGLIFILISYSIVTTLSKIIFG